MSRNAMVTAVQKTYDDSYLSCSTAVFYESQGNETEATRYWKSALDRIRDHHTRHPKSIIQSTQDETEKALAEALKELELQCRERIDILEALKASRQSIDHVEAAINGPSGSKSIGQGTIPAVTYSQLSRPVLPDLPLYSPQRPSGNPEAGMGILDAVYRQGPSPTLSSPSQGLKQGKTSRPSSPEKHSMRTTLRSGKAGEKLNKFTAKNPKSDGGEGSSKAATLAWNTYELREPLHQTTLHDASSPSSLSLRQLAEQLLKTRSSPAQWDRRARRLVSSSEKEFSPHPTKSPIMSRHFSEYSSSHPSLLSVSAATNALCTYPIPESHRSSGQEDLTSPMMTVGCSTSPMSCGEDSKASSPDSNNNENHNHNHNNHSHNHHFDNHSGPLGKRHAPRMPHKRDIMRDRVGLSSSSDPSKSPPHGPLRRDESPKLQHSSFDLLSGNPKDQIQSNKALKGKNCVNLRPDGNAQQGTSAASNPAEASWVKKKSQILRNLPPGIDDAAAGQILNDIVVQGDEVHWGDIAGLEIAKNALRETVVYPFLRPDLFMGLREPARGMLLFGPPGTGKTMLARAVATESRSTFFSISASSLTSKYLGESEKLVKALFHLARALAPSIIFVDEIDSLLAQRSGSGEHEATRRIKTEFLIQWSDLQRAAAGRELTERDKERGDANRVLVLAATNLPWAIDEAARRRFVRRQYIPLPEPTTRRTQLRTLLGQQKHVLSADDLNSLVQLTDGFSGSDITALAKDAAMGPLRSLGEALLHTTTEEIRPIQFADFESSLGTIRPSVGKRGLEKYEDWAREFGERGG